VNKLAGETSPYLLQHAENPVEWHPWGDEALELARGTDRPILLSIGYSACHWCHVMAHESFEDPETAALMNRLFVNIKVDREERPDIDAVYMNAVVSLTGQGGWPMTVFLTPSGEPFYGGTYYPPVPRHGMPSFSQVLEAVAAAYRDRRAEVDDSAGRLTAALDAASRVRGADAPFSEDTFAAGVEGMRRVYDPVWGGFGRAPKFPPASAIEFLLRAHRRGIEGALEMATGTLDGMAAGGMYDILAGGFARYSVDERWLVPHFEKMLYDNALLASAYLHGFAVTGQPGYRRVAEATLDHLLTDMLLPGGGFASALDADTLGEEGLTYVWTPGELASVLGPEDGAAAAAYYGVGEPGTFEGGTSVLRPQGERPVNLESIDARLLEARRARPQPGRDDKAIAAWNGLALAALAESGWRLDRADHLVAAERCADVLLNDMSPGGVLHRSYRDGDVRAPAFLDDVAAVANGLIELHTATGDPAWLDHAIRLAEDAAERFHDDDAGGFLYADPAGERLVARHKDLDDNPTPSGQSLLATVLLRLSRVTGRGEERAVEVFRLAMPHVERAYHGFGQLLCALDLYLSPPVEVAVIGVADDPAAAELADAARAGFHPTAVYAFGDGLSARGLALLEGKGLVGGRPAVYVCERFACQAPVTDPAQVRIPA
jgi:uncharacterized protein YyaL (SSP411 family)